jgi:tfoX N-terminal domain protein
MLLVDDSENKELLAELFEKMYEELPMPKIKKKK